MCRSYRLTIKLLVPATAREEVLASFQASASVNPNGVVKSAILPLASLSTFAVDVEAVSRWTIVCVMQDGLVVLALWPIAANAIIATVTGPALSRVSVLAMLVRHGSGCCNVIACEDLTISICVLLYYRIRRTGLF